MSDISNTMMSAVFQPTCEPRMTYDYERRMTIVMGQPKCELPVALRTAIDTAMIQYDMERRARRYDQQKLEGGP